AQIVAVAKVEAQPQVHLLDDRRKDTQLALRGGRADRVGHRALQVDAPAFPSLAQARAGWRGLRRHKLLDDLLFGAHLALQHRHAPFQGDDAPQQVVGRGRGGHLRHGEDFTATAGPYAGEIEQPGELLDLVRREVDVAVFRAPRVNVVDPLLDVIEPAPVAVGRPEGQPVPGSRRAEDQQVRPDLEGFLALAGRRGAVEVARLVVPEPLLQGVAGVDRLPVGVHGLLTGVVGRPGLALGRPDRPGAVDIALQRLADALELGEDQERGFAILAGPDDEPVDV